MVGNRSLSAVEVGLVNVMSRETVLRQYVDSAKQDYDYVLLDCRPSLGMLVINALSASDYVLVPVQADYLAAENMPELVGDGIKSAKFKIYVSKDKTENGTYQELDSSFYCNNENGIIHLDSLKPGGTRMWRWSLRRVSP